VGTENAVKVLDKMSFADGFHKNIEQVGSAYEKIKVRIYK